MIRNRLFLLTLFSIVLPSFCNAQIVYSTNFDNLSLGNTEAPANPGHDGWTSIFHPGASFGAIQNTIANVGNAIQQYTDVSNSGSEQSIDRRAFSPKATSSIIEAVFDIDFYATTSNVEALNSYNASAFVDGDGSVFGFSIGGGNGTLKSQTGVSIGLATFNGVDNNEPVSIMVGQHLDWDAWHTVQLKANLLTNEWISVTVDGNTQSLTGIELARNFPGGVPTIASFMDGISLQVVNSEGFGDQTSDSIYFDNLSLSIVSVPEPASTSALLFPILLVLLRRNRRQF